MVEAIDKWIKKISFFFWVNNKYTKPGLGKFSYQEETKEKPIRTTWCGAVGKVSPPVDELPIASLAWVRNPLEVLCGQGKPNPERGLISSFECEDISWYLSKKKTEGKKTYL